MKDKTIIILPYIQEQAQGSELIISLKLWKKFCQFNFNMIVIGEFDKSLKDQFPWVEFIKCPTKTKIEGQYNPHLDIQHKMEVVINKYSQNYNAFIRTSDDVYPIKPFSLDDIKTPHYLAQSFDGAENRPQSYWLHNKWKTRQLLDAENLPHIDYTTHFPYYYEFSKLNEIWDKYNMRNESYVLEDLYFNYFEHPAPVLVDTIRLGIWFKCDYIKHFRQALENPNIKFICNSNYSWCEELENELRQII